ncbi:MAG: DUF2917 domain-containing protein [Burkholderiales bacterium]|nr:DUF2917 domain-containing protein [Burkholderiales bacterium]
MDNLLHWDRIALASGALLRLRDAVGSRVVCVRGQVWLTEPGDPVDHFLHPADDHRIAHAGLVIIEATESAELMVLPAP